MNVKCNGVEFDLHRALVYGMEIDNKDEVITELFNENEGFHGLEDSYTRASETIESLKEYLDSPELLDIDEKIDELNSECIEFINDEAGRVIIDDSVIEKLTCDVTTLILKALKEKLKDENL